MDQEEDRDSLDLQSANDESVETESVAKRSSISQTSTTPGIRDSISSIKMQVSKKISSIRRKSSTEPLPVVGSNLKTDDPFNEVGQGLKHIYHKIVEPIEKKCNFHQMVTSQPYDEAEFEAKPLVLLMGQYSTGKSTFIKYLIGEEYPDITIGTEPTTDRFVAVLKGPEKKVLQGHALVNLKNLPFRNLSMFGNSFLSRLQASMVAESGILEGICFVDTPGILTGKRDYDFAEAIEWFASRADRILIFFDANKLDISEKLVRILKGIDHHVEKVRVVFNKADSLGKEELLRTYGSLMWGLGKIFQTPEPLKIYVGSYWDKPFKNNEWEDIFVEDQVLLFEDIKKLPVVSATRKIGDFTKRLRSLQAYVLVINELLVGVKKKKSILIKNLEHIYKTMSVRHNLPLNDFPRINDLKAKLELIPWDKIKQVPKKDLERIQKIFNDDLAQITALLPEVGQWRHANFTAPMKAPRKKNKRLSSTAATNGTLNDLLEKKELEMPSLDIKITKKMEGNWITSVKSDDNYQEWIDIFNQFNPSDGKVEAKFALAGCGLTGDDLRKILKTAELEDEEFLTLEEFAFVNYLKKHQT